MNPRNTTRKEPSVWDHKPFWCQPWTILLTGALVVAGSWFVLRVWWLTLLVGLAVLAWWILFLVVVPQAWKASLTSGDDVPAA